MQNTTQELITKFELAKCFQCGKCTSGCPVSLKSVLNIRRLMREVLLSPDTSNILAKTDLWDCTTCQTCTLRCPRGLKPHELVIAIRSLLVEEGNLPKTVIDALEGVYKHGNPWGRARGKRSEWAAELNIKNVAEGAHADLLYFACCATAYDPRVQEMGKALVKTLTAAGVDFGFLGNQETCCASESRRMGEEGLFEMVSEDNLKLFHDCGITKMFTTSPHCYNTFKNEYKDFDIEVKHYTQIVSELIQEGKIKFSRDINLKVTYHDPCYLGKQNKIFDEPRSIIQAIPGITFIEFDRNRERSLCCEGGGGRMFVEASNSEGRLAETRIKDAVSMGVDVIATACPFCLLNLEDAVKTTGNTDKVVIKDIMELVADAI
ncbi:MAG: (Fe-S)-binding protein [Dehalococcoidales bacterium]|nr:(Fe-S)-binding protein [Dehalococcoidales bacterium]